MLIRKAHAGGDSYGNQWPVDGAVLDLPDTQAADLLSIPGAGFTIADTLDPGDPDGEVTEPAPDHPGAVTEPAPTRRRRARG